MADTATRRHPNLNAGLPPLARDAAILEARRAADFRKLAEQTTGRATAQALARGALCARAAGRFAEACLGYREHIISADGVLLVLVVARESHIDPQAGPFCVRVEDEADPRHIHFGTRHLAAAFLRVAAEGGLARAAAARRIAPTALPGQQGDLFATEGQRHAA